MTPIIHPSKQSQNKLNKTKNTKHILGLSNKSSNPESFHKKLNLVVLFVFFAVLSAIQLNGSWNGVLLVEAAPNTPINDPWNVNKNPNSSATPDTYFGNWTNHTYFPSPSDWRTIPIYQLITDRYNDGDPTV